MLPPESIKEFQAIYKKVYGIEIDDKEALKRAGNLFRLYNAVYGSPDKKIKSQKFR